MPLPIVTQTDFQSRLAEETEYSKADVKFFLDSLQTVVGRAVANCERVKFAGLVVEPALRKATKKRLGRNPQTGEQVEIAAKPASVRIKLTALKPLKEKAPSVQKLKKRLPA
jgi:nucleoid DNA-binding protein